MYINTGFTTSLENRKGMVILWVLMGLTFLIGGILTSWYLVISPHQKMTQVHSWQKIPCLIEESFVSSYESEDSDDSSSTTMYSAQISFTYEVDNNKYKSDKISLSGFANSSSSNKEPWQKIIAPFPEGSRSICYVNPADPAEAVLDPKMKTGDLLIGAGMSVIFILCGIMFLFISTKWNSWTNTSSARAEVEQSIQQELTENNETR